MGYYIMDKMEKYNRFYMGIAEVVSKMSVSERLKVGSVLVKKNNIISFGWNGMPSGMSNDCEYNINGKLVTRSEVLHSEANCITKVAKSTYSSEGATLYTTTAPCMECAKLIHQAGITSVYYINEYSKNNKGTVFLLQCNILIKKIEPTELDIVDPEIKEEKLTMLEWQLNEKYNDENEIDPMIAIYRGKNGEKLPDFYPKTD